MSYLDAPAFKNTFGEKMIRIEDATEPPFDFWPYFESIPDEDFRGYDCFEGRVDWVWRSEDGSFEHVLISAKEDTDVFMVIVLDLHHDLVVGHRLLDLKDEYGLRER